MLDLATDPAIIALEFRLGLVAVSTAIWLSVLGYRVLEINSIGGNGK